MEASMIYGFMRVGILGQSKGDSSIDALNMGQGEYRNVLKMADRTL